VRVVTGGHQVDLDAFLALADEACAAALARRVHAVQPTAQQWLRADAGARWTAVLLYDIAGLRLRRGEAPAPVGPSVEVIGDLDAMLDAGVGLVVLHHALASWPAWDGWAEAVGGRFLYAPGELRGRRWPSSGTCRARYTARVVDPDHPVCAGVGDLVLDDETYLCPVFEHDVVPLLRGDFSRDPRRFVSTYEHVVVGEAMAPDCTGHPTGSDLVAWATSAGSSPIVYVQPGDSAATLAVPGYRRLVANALKWVASPRARAWALARRGQPTLVERPGGRP
jgi:type 1 glutamine amidotransferase